VEIILGILYKLNLIAIYIIYKYYFKNSIVKHSITKSCIKYLNKQSKNFIIILLLWAYQVIFHILLKIIEI
jgi:hypothetical protein